MEKIKIYDLLSSKEGIYISYLISEINKHESEWRKTYESRDRKLTLILNDDLLIVSGDVKKLYTSLKNKINDLDFTKPDIISKMDLISEELEKTVQYTKYLVEKIKTCECQNIEE